MKGCADLRGYNTSVLCEIEFYQKLLICKKRLFVCDMYYFV